MGEKLVKLYQIVTDKGGLEARIKLAQRTGVPKSKAAQATDTDEVLEKFKKIASEILGKNVDEFL